jgi:hypothetical protein
MHERLAGKCETQLGLIMCLGRLPLNPHLAAMVGLLKPGPVP